MNEFEFSKYQGLGNDFIIIDARKIQIAQSIKKITPKVIQKLCQRNFGVGANGIIFILASEIDCDMKMRIVNSDGTEAEMCGNGIRCLIKYLFDNNYVSKSYDKRVNVETLSGVIKAEYNDNGEIKVDMGLPIFNPMNIPTKLDMGNYGISQGTIELDNRNIDVYSVGMGNPHLITYVEDLDVVKIEEWGPSLENNSLFPLRTNVHFVKLIDSQSIEVLVWERGCGRTYACGTGACACAVTSMKLNLCKNEVEVKLEGGLLNIDWQGEDVPVFMTGEAKLVYKGKFSLEYSA